MRYDLDGFPELYEVVRRWTADGEMKFRWPADIEIYWKEAGEFWDKFRPLLLALAGSKTEDSKLYKAFDALREANEGPAIEAFLEYWDTVPSGNAVALALQCRMFSDLLKGTYEGISAYKKLALENLYVLKEALDENEKYSWTFWLPFGADASKVNRQARGLIRQFDAEMLTYRAQLLEQLNQDWSHYSSKTRVILRQVAKEFPEKFDALTMHTF